MNINNYYGKQLKKDYLLTLNDMFKQVRRVSYFHAADWGIWHMIYIPNSLFIFIYLHVFSIDESHMNADKDFIKSWM